MEGAVAAKDDIKKKQADIDAITQTILASKEMCIRDRGTPEEVFGAPKSERLQEFLSRVL